MNIVKLYTRGSFVIRLFLMDMEFEKIKDNVGLAEVNTTAARDHMGEIERHIHLVKERSRCSTSDMLNCGIVCLTKQIVIHLVYNVCLWINVFPLKLGLSMEYSPRELVTQRYVSYKNNCKAEFGSYVEASTEAMAT